MIEPRRTSRASRRLGPIEGAAYVEFIIAVMPMLAFFWGMMQLNGLLLADLVVRHAAMNAVRAAIVCGSDPKPDVQGCATRAAAMTTQAVKSIEPTQSRDVTVSGTTGNFGTGTVAVEVTANYKCQVPLVGSAVCGLMGSGGFGHLKFSRTARMPNQGMILASD